MGNLERGNKMSVDVEGAVETDVVADQVQEVAPDSQPAQDPPYPADTPVGEMTPEQQAAYYKAQARKHEKAWKKVADRNLTPEAVLKMESDLAEFRRAQLSESEAAVEEAKSAARAEAFAEVGGRYAETMLRMLLRNRGMSDDAVDTVVGATNLAAFLDDGEPDGERLEAFAGTIGVPAGGRQAVPDPKLHGNGRSGNPPVRATGQELMAKYLKK
jgi:hypothetical protein